MDKLIRVSVVSTMTGLSKSEIARQVRVHRFPQPIRIGSRCTRWSETEVADWIEAIKKERTVTETSTGELA